MPCINCIVQYDMVWLWIKSLFCWEAHPPLVTNHFFAARRYIPSSRMLGAGLPHNKSLSQRCLLQARTSCYKPMSRNGRPSLLQTKYLLFTVIQQNQYNVHPKALIFHCLAAGTVTSNHLEDGLALPGEKGNPYSAMSKLWSLFGSLL